MTFIECDDIFRTASRTSPLGKFVEQAIEKYAKLKPGHGQSSLFDAKPVQSHTKKWTDEDEKKHPRDESGEFASKGEEGTRTHKAVKPEAKTATDAGGTIQEAMAAGNLDEAAKMIGKRSIDKGENIHAIMREVGLDGNVKRDMTRRVITAKDEMAVKPDILATKAAAGQDVKKPESISDDRWRNMVKQKMAEQIHLHIDAPKPEVAPVPDAITPDEQFRYDEISKELAKHGIQPEDKAKWLKRVRETAAKKKPKEEVKPEEPKPKEPAQPTTKEPPKAETTPPEGDQEDKPVHDSLFDTKDGKDPTDHDTPRKAAEEATKRQIDADYAFARESSVRNAGEDLLGSARHRANAWKGLDQAEKDGTASEFVNREMLLKMEPHGLMNHVARNPLTALAMHYAMRNFPAVPQYGKRALVPEKAKEARAEYLEVYRAYKAKAESLAAGEEDPRAATQQLQKFVEGERGRLYRNGKENAVGNALYATSKSLSSRHSGIGKQLEDFSRAFAKKHHEGKPIGTDNHPEDTLEKLTTHASDIIEGASLNKTFGITSDKKSKPTFNAADAYVKKAERIGGPAVSVKDATEGRDFLVGKLKMRGLQFGNYVTDEEREHHLLKVSEAFTDLADVLGLPEHLVSWKGKLGIAFGARGHGTASAHHEPSNNVINLTRASGVGALAHEWGHFFDHALGGFATVGEKTGYFSEKSHLTAADRADRKAMAIRNGIKTSEYDVDNQAMHDAYSALHKSMDESGFNRRLSGVLSKYVREKTMGEKKREYWRSTREKFARCFERYVERKLTTQGRKNTYLTGLANAHELWPSDEEVDAMTPHFDAIFAELKANKEKYSRLFASRSTTAQRLASQVVERYRFGTTRQIKHYAASSDLPEGSTKIVDGRGYVLRKSRWHRDRNPNERAPSIVVRGDEMGPESDPKELRKKANAFLKAEFGEPETQKRRTLPNADMGWQIGLSRDGRRKLLSFTANTDKIHLLSQIRSIILNAAYEGDAPPDKPNSKYDWYYRFHTEAIVRNKPVEFELIVGASHQNERWLWDITDLQEIGKPAEQGATESGSSVPATNPGAERNSGTPPSSGPSTTIIDPKTGKVKSEPPKESYSRRLSRQLVEIYARHRPASSQAGLFANPAAPDKAWREELHPRDHGKFTEKSAGEAGEAGEGPAPGQKDLFGGEPIPPHAAMKKIEEKGEIPNLPKQKQEQLFHGLKDAPGQQDLFNADKGAGEVKPKIPENIVNFIDPESGDRQQGAVISKSAKAPGKWQITFYDVDGPSSDRTVKDRDAAIKELLQERFQPTEQPHYANLVTTPRFLKGIDTTKVIGMINEMQGKVKGRDVHTELLKALHDGGYKAASGVYADLKKSQMAQQIVEHIEANQLTERYARTRDVSDEARAADGTWTAGPSSSTATTKPPKKIDRTTWGKQNDRCWICNQRGSDTTPLHTHEIARGPARQAAMKTPAAWLRTCQDCHGKLPDIAGQLALKRRHDAEHYDREEVNLLRGRQPNAITEADVDQAEKKLPKSPLFMLYSRLLQRQMVERYARIKSTC